MDHKLRYMDNEVCYTDHKMCYHKVLCEMFTFHMLISSTRKYSRRNLDFKDVIIIYHSRENCLYNPSNKIDFLLRQWI